MINELTQNEKQIKTGKPENIYYGFYKGRFAAIYSAMGNPDGYFRQQLKVRNIGGNKYNFNPDFIVVSKAIYDKHPEDYIKLKPYVDEFWDRINNESVNEELIMINENESEVEYLMSKFYEYRNLAAEAGANGAKEEAANFNKQAMEYYERAMDLEVANMSNSDLSPEDQAMIDKYEDEEANREVPRDYASMYEAEGEEELSPAEQMIQKLIAMAEKGEFDNDQIRSLGQQLTSARKRYFTAQRSPESYKAAAEKAKATKAQSRIDAEKDLAKSKEISIAQNAVLKARHDGGMLPYRLDDYSKKPNPKYYTFIMNDPGSGVGLYKLRDKYKNTVIGTENPDGTVNPVTDADIYAAPGVKPSMKAYMEETKNNKMENINLNRWAKLAGINENEEIRQYQGSEEWEGSISGLGKEEHPQGFAEMRDIILSKYPEEGGSTYQMDVYYNNDRVATGVSGGFAIEKGNVYFDFKFQDGKVVDYSFDEQKY